MFSPAEAADMADDERPGRVPIEAGRRARPRCEPLTVHAGGEHGDRRPHSPSPGGSTPCTGSDDDPVDR
jgi:hypothetical protein